MSFGSSTMPDMLSAPTNTPVTSTSIGVPCIVSGNTERTVSPRTRPVTLAHPTRAISIAPERASPSCLSSTVEDTGPVGEDPMTSHFPVTSW